MLCKFEDPMRVYVSPDSIFPEKNIIEIRDTGELHHMRDVVRLRQGMDINVFDGRGNEYSGEIKKLTRDFAVVAIKSKIENKDHFPFKLTLYQAIPKKNKMDLIVEKAVELGVDTIVPIITERAVHASKAGHWKERWGRIAKAASKQCGRAKLAAIVEPMDFRDALIESNRSELVEASARAQTHHLVIFATLDKYAKPLKDILRAHVTGRVSVFVGPEGDFSQREISMAKENNYSICSLGAFIFRVETAAIYILSCLNYEYNK